MTALPPLTACMSCWTLAMVCSGLRRRRLADLLLAEEGGDARHREQHDGDDERGEPRIHHQGQRQDDRRDQRADAVQRDEAGAAEEPGADAGVLAFAVISAWASRSSARISCVDFSVSCVHQLSRGGVLRTRPGARSRSCRPLRSADSARGSRARRRRWWSSAGAAGPELPVRSLSESASRRPAAFLTVSCALVCACSSVFWTRGFVPGLVGLGLDLLVALAAVAGAEDVPDASPATSAALPFI